MTVYLINFVSRDWCVTIEMLFKLRLLIYSTFPLFFSSVCFSKVNILTSLDLFSMNSICNIAICFIFHLESYGWLCVVCHGFSFLFLLLVIVGISLRWDSFQVLYDWAQTSELWPNNMLFFSFYIFINSGLNFKMRHSNLLCEDRRCRFGNTSQNFFLWYKWIVFRSYGNFIHCHLLLVWWWLSWGRLLGDGESLGVWRTGLHFPHREGKSEAAALDPQRSGEWLMVWGRISLKLGKCW